MIRILDIAFIKVSIVLNVKAKAKTKIDIINKKLFDNINSKKAKSGIIFEFKEKEISPVYPIHKTIKNVINK